MDNTTSRWASLIKNRRATNKLLLERRTTLNRDPLGEVASTEDDLEEASTHVAAARKTSAN